MWLAQPFVVQDRRDSVTGYQDISPRVGAAYDVFGTGKTSTPRELGQVPARRERREHVSPAEPGVHVPVQHVDQLDRQRTTTRVVDCNLRDPNTPTNQAMFCGGWNKPDLGSALSAHPRQPPLSSGWGVRPVDQQFNISVQQEVLPRVSVEVGYAHQSWDNIYYTHSEGLTSAELRVIDFPDPASTRNLPGGGGGTTPVPESSTQAGQTAVPEQHTSQNAPAGADDNVMSGKGMDLNVNARMRNGLNNSGRHHLGRRAPGILRRLGGLTRSRRQQPSRRVRYSREWFTNLPRPRLGTRFRSIDVLVSTIMRSTLGADAGGGFDGVRLERLLAERELHRSRQRTITPILGRPLANNAPPT